MQNDVKPIIQSLLESYNECEATIKFDPSYQMNHSVIVGIIEKLRQIIFPCYFGKKNISKNFIEYHIGELLEEIIFDMTKQVGQALKHHSKSNGEFEEDAKTAVCKFLSSIVDVRRLLASDVDATFEGDPAANSKDEIISSYPGIYAIMVNRLANVLYKLDIPLIPRIMTEQAHGITGIDIHPGASIGHHFFIDHGTGIVIGETTIIGNNVKIYQGVTLGALSTRDGQALKSIKRHPTIKDNVTIYSGASILGGATIIGEGVVVGSNAFITTSIPQNSRVSVRNPELQIKTDAHKIEYKELEHGDFWDYQI